MFGLTGDGFKKKRLIDIKEEIEAELKDKLGENISLIPQSVFGQIVGICSERESLEWDSLENVYNAFYPSTAQGSSLSDLVLLNAIQRKEATQSTATVTVGGTDGTVIPIGSTIKTNDTNEIFSIDSEVTISGDTSTTATAKNYGKVVAIARSLNTIDSPISGWDTVTNSSDARVGRLEETDPELRIRREVSVGADAQNLTDSLFSQLKNLEGVSDVKVLENKTASTDASGIPPYQFLALVRGGENIDIAKIVWNNTPQGIQSYGNITVDVEDAQGYLQDVYFSRPTDKDIFFVVDITTNSSFPIGGDDEIKTNMVLFGNDSFGISDDVIQSRFFTPINKTAGIIDIEIKIGFTSNPTLTTNLTIAPTEVSAYDTTRIIMNVT